MAAVASPSADAAGPDPADPLVRAAKRAKKNRVLMRKLALRGDVAGLKALLRDCPEAVNYTDSNGATCVHHAAFNGHVPALKLLFKFGARVDTLDSDGCSPLHNAAYNGQTAAVRLLIERGAQLNLRDQHDESTPLHKAAFNGHAAALRLLLELGADPMAQDADGLTALQKAAFNNHVDCLAVLVEKRGAELVGLPDAAESTALHKAAANGHAESLALLLREGADINAADKDRVTAVHFAAFNNHVACLRLLIEHGADACRASKFGHTALHYAALNGHLDAARLLIAAGLSPNAQDAKGLTALHYAVKKDHPDCVQLLLDHRANPNLRDAKGRRPLKLRCQTASGRRIYALLSVQAREPGRRVRARKATAPIASVLQTPPRPLANTTSRTSPLPVSPSHHHHHHHHHRHQRAATTAATKKPVTDVVAAAVVAAAAAAPVAGEKTRPNTATTKNDNSSTSDDADTGADDSDDSSDSDNVSTSSVQTVAELPSSGQPSAAVEALDFIADELDDQPRPTTPTSTATKGSRLVPGATTVHALPMSTSCTFDRPASQSKGTDKSIPSSSIPDGYRRNMHGFLVKSDVTVAPGQAAGRGDHAPKLLKKHKDKKLATELKWAKALKKWQHSKRSDTDIVSKNIDWIRKHCERGLPDSVRGRVWRTLLRIDDIRDKAAQNGTPSFRELSVDRGTEFGAIILRDINRTFPNHFLFQQDKGQGQQSLYRILLAYSNYNPSVGYCQGMGFLVALFLMYFQEEEDAFWGLVRLLDPDGMDMATLYSQDMPKVAECSYVVGRLLKNYVPRLDAHLNDLGVDPGLYAPQLFITVFLYNMPFDLCLRIWDRFLIDGFAILFPIAVAILKIFEDDLCKMDFEAVMKFLKFDNQQGDDAEPVHLDPEEVFRVADKLKIKQKFVVRLQHFHRDQASKRS